MQFTIFLTVVINPYYEGFEKCGFWYFPGGVRVAKGGVGLQVLRSAHKLGREVPLQGWTRPAPLPRAPSF